MISILLKGGLGNMLFQIAAGIAFAKKNNTDLELYNLESHFNYLNNEKIYQPKRNHSFEYLKLNQFKKFYKTDISSNAYKKIVNYPFEYICNIPPDNVIVEGFFQSEKYFIEERKNILSIFKPTIDIEKQLHKYNFRNYNTTSIHVRRGDYLKFNNIHTVQNLEYYNQALKITESYTDKYIVFSDDVDWCKNNFLGNNFIFVENEKDYIELYLMSYCNNNIISNSSFSWWGAWMNNNLNKIVIGPKNWFSSNIYSDKDILPEKWIKI
jgi:hypothetical protein